MNIQTLSTEQLFKVAPSIFAQQPWDKVSDKYRFIPTIDVVEELRREGFSPVKAQQSRTRIVGKGDFTKHLIRFRHADVANVVGTEVPEVVLINSHDRTSGFQLSAGIFRIVCSNGLVVKSSSFGDINVHHTGENTAGRVLEGAYSIIENIPQLTSKIEEFKGIELLPHEQLAYANAALQLRYPSDEVGNSTAPIVGDKLLTVRRLDDQGRDLWTTFNRVQENFVKGGLRGYGSTGKRLKTRGINSVTEDVRLNKALWVLTEELAKALH